MKASQVIARRQDLIQEHGDADVAVVTCETAPNISSISPSREMDSSGIDCGPVFFAYVEGPLLAPVDDSFALSQPDGFAEAR